MTKQLKNIDGELLRSSIAKSDFKTAKKLIDKFLDQEPTKADKGEVYVETIALYMDLVNSMNDSYIKQLKSMTETLKTIDAGESEVNKEIQIIRTKKKLRSIVQEDDLD
ncbi:MAG TPA: hypothetical protein VGE62_00755 [Candidatus Paceibacterota bacterium]